VTAFKAGDIAASQLTAAQSSAANARTLAAQARLDLADAALALDHLLGLPPGTGVRLSVPTTLPRPQQSPDQLYQLAIAHRADLQAFRAAYDAQEASVHKAVLDQFPSLDLAINAARDTGGNKLLGPAVGFTLPLWNRNKGGIAIERATRTALKSEYEARLATTRTDISSAVAALKTSLQKRRFLEMTVRGRTSLANHSRQAALAGDLPSAAASDTIISHRDGQIALLTLEQSTAEQMIALELLTGLPKEQWK